MSDTKHLVSFTAAIGIPAGQALITGFMFSVIGGSLAELAGKEPLPWAGVTFGAVSLYTWTVGLSWWRDAIAPQLQAEPVQMAASETIRLEVIGGTDGPYPWADWLDLPIEAGTLRAAFQALANGRDLSMSSLAGRGKVLSRSEFCILRDALISSGLARWMNPRSHTQGCQLTARGRATIRGYSMAPLPGPSAPSGRLIQESGRTLS